MTANKIYALGLAALLALVLWPQSVRADEWNQITKLSFNQPIEIPGLLLPAGTYWFKLGPSTADRDVVEIYSLDWKHLYAMRETVPVERAKTTGRTELRFAERPHSNPKALLDWYYPDQTEGHEFLYSARTEHEIAGDTKQDVQALPGLDHARQAAVTRAVAPAAGED